MMNKRSTACPLWRRCSSNQSRSDGQRQLRALKQMMNMALPRPQI
jgi:hypothetical protein